MEQNGTTDDTKAASKESESKRASVRRPLYKYSTEFVPAYATLTGLGNKLVIARLIKFVENTRSSSEEIEF
jgi:hypothetical protein